MDQSLLNACQTVFGPPFNRNGGNKFEEDISDALIAKLNQNSLWRPEIDEKGVSVGRGVQVLRVDLGKFLKDNVTSLVEVKVIERYNKNKKCHKFPYILLDHTPVQDPPKPNEYFDCFENNNVNHYEEGQLLKDIVKILTFENILSPNIPLEKYIVFYILSDSYSNLVHSLGPLSAKLNCFFSYFDQLSNAGKKYSVQTGKNKYLTIGYSPLNMSGVFSYLGIKNVASGQCRHVSVVLIKFKTCAAFSFSMVEFKC